MHVCLSCYLDSCGIAVDSYEIPGGTARPPDHIKAPCALTYLLHSSCLAMSCALSVCDAALLASADNWGLLEVSLSFGQNGIIPC